MSACTPINDKHSWQVNLYSSLELSLERFNRISIGTLFELNDFGMTSVAVSLIQLISRGDRHCQWRQTVHFKLRLSSHHKKIDHFTPSAWNIRNAVHFYQTVEFLQLIWFPTANSNIKLYTRF